MGIKVGEYFIEKKIIKQVDLDKALEYQKKHKGYLGEILFFLEMITENDLLQYLSKRFNVQYISSEKLEKMSAQSPADVIPERLAVDKNIYPLKYSFNNFRLTLLTHEPQNIAMFDELKVLLTGVNTVTPVVAVSNAIKAIVYKQYKGDFSAFDRLVNKGVEMNLLTPGSEAVISYDSVENIGETIQGMMAESGDSDNTRSGKTFSTILNQGEILRDNTSLTASMVSMMPRLSQNYNEQMTELIRVFTNLLDMTRGDAFFGHTQRVVNLSQEIGGELGLTDVELHDLLIAGYLHDVGKKHHFIASDIKTRSNIEKIIKNSGIGSRLFINVDLSKLTLKYLSSMYETYNGLGVPDGLRLNDVPVGSQILLIADSYDYMIRISKISPPEAYKNLKETLFFSDKIVVALKKVEEIESVVTSSIEPLFEGLIISRKRFDCDDISDKFSRLNVLMHKSESLEKGAQIIKEKREKLGFILCDLDMPESSITPMKFLSALKHKKEFATIPFYFFSQYSVEKNTLMAAKTLRATAVFPNYHPIEMTRKIVEEVKKLQQQNPAPGF